MGSLTNQFVSSSYQGLLKLTDSTTGYTNTLQTVQSGDGQDGPLQISRTEVNISGSFYINNVPITNGTSGTSGTSGSSGVDGSSGTSGTSGGSGSSGSGGTSGTSGSSGSDGTSGTSGSSGSDGTSGTSGSSGSDGTSGTSGSSGSDGSSGTSGTSGSNGTDGTSGSSGSDGTSGTSGSSGSDGTSGTSGSSGSDGSSGTSGTSGSSGQSNNLFPYNARTNITSGNPGNTNIIWNNATQSGATQINVSHLDRNNQDIDVFLALIPSGSTIIIQDANDSNNFQKWIVGTGVEAAPNSYWTYPITFVSNGHQFTGGENILFIIAQTPSGTSGTSGTSGVSPSLDGLITTGSITTTQQITGSLILGNTVISGSLIGNTVNGGLIKVQSQTFSSNSLSIPFGYISSSNPDLQTNIIFGNGNVSSGSGLLTNNQTGSIVISGSNNIILNSNRANTLVTAGTYGYIGGNGNIGSTIPTFGTGSLIRPVMNFNALQAGMSLLFTTSSLSATPTINSNLIYGGVNINHQSGSVQLNNNGLIGGSLTSNQNITTSNSVATITNNLFTSNLATTLSHNSSTILYTGNIGAIVVNNNYSSSVSSAVDNIAVNQNLFNGNSNTLTVTGSNSSARRTFNSNLISGRVNLVNSNFDTGTGSFSGGHLVSTAILGEQLIVSASHIQSGQGGTVFVGRFNATGSLQESAQDTVFVVGNGVNAGSRRNALRIDNLGNSNFTGSVNVSGSVNVTGSLTLNGTSITPSDRNGLITTGSLGNSQTIAGALKISGSLSQPLQIGSGENISKIANVNNSTFLYRNSDTNNTVLGNVAGSANDSFTSGSNLNMLFTGFYLGFTSGSANTVIAGGGGAQFRSGSNNTIIGKTAELEFGNNNTYIGDVSGTPALEDNTLRISAGGSTILKKSGSLALQINSDTQVTGSLVVNNVLQLIATTTDPVTTSGVEGQLRFFDYGGLKQVLLFISGSGWLTLA